MIVRRTVLFILTFQFLFPHSLASQTHKEKANLLVTGGTVVTMDGSRRIIDDGA